MEAKELYNYLVGSGGLDLVAHAEKVMGQGGLQDGMTIEQELISYANYRGFNVLAVQRYYPPELDPFVPLRRVVVEVVVERGGRKIHFGNSLCVHPSVPLEEIDESVAWRYALVQPIKRQMWDFVSDGNEGEHEDCRG